MEGSDWVALAAVVSGAVVAVFSLMGQHRTHLAMRRFEERQQVYIDYLAWFEEHSSESVQSGPPVDLKARLMAWGSSPVIDSTMGSWTPTTAADLHKQIRAELWWRWQPEPFGKSRPGRRPQSRGIRKWLRRMRPRLWT
jgi:hypothetical protein